eukprot:1632468-Karenia_brevis.AAC.1
MRRSHSHAAHRNKKDPFFTSSSSTPVPTMLPSLEPEGQIPHCDGHIAMVTLRWSHCDGHKVEWQERQAP